MTSNASALHQTLAQLETGLRSLPEAPKDSGRVALIVCRRAPGEHDAIEKVQLSLEEGVTGDEWKRRGGKLDAQITVIRRDVSELISNGQSLTISGDNLVVDM